VPCCWKRCKSIARRRTWGDDEEASPKHMDETKTPTDEVVTIKQDVDSGKSPLSMDDNGDNADENNDWGDDEVDLMEHGEQLAFEASEMDWSDEEEGGKEKEVTSVTSGSRNMSEVDCKLSAVNLNAEKDEDEVGWE
jgi:hypothetical protein